jgi:hypothetical protein
MYTVILVAAIVAVVIIALAWQSRRSAATHPPTRAGSPRMPRDDATAQADRVEPDEGER